MLALISCGENSSNSPDDAYGRIYFEEYCGAGENIEKDKISLSSGAIGVNLEMFDELRNDSVYIEIYDIEDNKQVYSDRNWNATGKIFKFSAFRIRGIGDYAAEAKVLNNPELNIPSATFTVYRDEKEISNKNRVFFIKENEDEEIEVDSVLLGEENCRPVVELSEISENEQLMLIIKNDYGDDIFNHILVTDSSKKYLFPFFNAGIIGSYTAESFISDRPNLKITPATVTVYK